MVVAVHIHHAVSAGHQYKASSLVSTHYVVKFNTRHADAANMTQKTHIADLDDTLGHIIDNGHGQKPDIGLEAIKN